jgi:hypothetical protein
MKEFTARFSHRFITIIGIQFLLFANARYGLKCPPRNCKKLDAEAAMHRTD